jgi:hypothetical protein
MGVGIMPYCVIQKYYVIAGTGQTRQEAVRDAEMWMDIRRDASLILVPYWEAKDGDMCLIECTDELYRQVETEGGDVPFVVVSLGNGKPIADVVEHDE